MAAPKSLLSVLGAGTLLPALPARHRRLFLSEPPTAKAGSWS